MKCKFCNEELPERGNFCPICGGDNSEAREEIRIDPDDLVLELNDLLQDEEEKDELTLDQSEDLYDSYEDDEYEDDQYEDDAQEDVQEEPVGPSPALKKARSTNCVLSA